MPATQGFACEAADVASITTSYAIAQVVTLGANITRDASAKAVPAGGMWSYLDVQVLKTGGAPTTVEAVITWDTAGDDPAYVTTVAADLVAAGTTANTFIGTLPLNFWPSTPWGAADGAARPAAYVTGRVYVQLRVDAGTVTLKKARLHFRDHFAG